MPIKMLCPTCRTPLTIADKLAGRALACPKCSAQFTVPGGTLVTPQAQPKAEEDDLKLYMPGHGASSHQDNTTYKRCPGCGRDVEASVKLCTGCGYNFDTGKTLKGHVIREPDAWKRYAEAIIRNGFFIIIFVVGAYGIYYVATKTDFLRDIQKNPTDLKDQPGQPGQPQPPGKTPEAPQSLLVVSNARFTALLVFANREKIGQVEQGKTGKFRLPAPAADKPVVIAFEAKLVTGAQLDDKTKQALETGLAFGGTTSEGVRLEFKGPPAGLVPESGESLKGLVIGTHISRDAATGLGFCKEIPYKESLLKPVPPLTALRVTWKDSASGPSFIWLPQDCVVERDGKAAYTPPAPPFEASKVKLVTKDGKVDVQP